MSKIHHHVNVVIWQNTSYELKARPQIQKWEFRFTRYEFKSTNFELNFISYEFKSTNFELNFISYEFKSTSSRII